jgi:hypothetical protein
MNPTKLQELVTDEVLRALMRFQYRRHGQEQIPLYQTPKWKGEWSEKSTLGPSRVYWERKVFYRTRYGDLEGRVQVYKGYLPNLDYEVIVQDLRPTPRGEPEYVVAHLIAPEPKSLLK